MLFAQYAISDDLSRVKKCRNNKENKSENQQSELLCSPQRPIIRVLVNRAGHVPRHFRNKTKSVQDSLAITQARE